MTWGMNANVEGGVGRDQLGDTGRGQVTWRFVLDLAQGSRGARGGRLGLLKSWTSSPGER